MTNFLPLLAALHLALLQSQLPLWVAGLSWVIFAASFLFKRRSPPSGRLVEGLAVAAAIAIYATVRPALGVESSAALIQVFLALETWRLRDRRSQWRFVFLILTSLSLILLDHNGWLWTFFLLADLAFVFQMMSQFEGGSTSLSWTGLRSALALILSSLPLWIVIFLLFPRFTLDLWGNENSGSGGEVGFSDSIEPGSIESQITNNTEVAFRFRWRGDHPSSRFYYFRGAVLDSGEGLSWHVANLYQNLKMASNADHLVEQEIWGEARNGRSLIALDRPVKMDSPERQIQAHDTNMFRLFNSPHGTFFYRAWSAVEPPAQELSEFEKAKATKVGATLSEELQQYWGTEAWARLRSAPLAEKLKMIEARFHEEKFRYSLSPPPLQSKGLMEFLIRTKVGFCEHYAAATATILRASGTPARVIAGFLGGRPDPFTADWVVMTREAHAWIEAYDPQKQAWVREDPTMWIEPLRGDFGADLYWLPQELRDQLAQNGTQILPWWPQFREKMDLAWQASFVSTERWVMTYDTSWLRHWLTPLGAENLETPISILLLMGLGGAVASLIPFMRIWLRPGPSEWEKIWRQFLRRIAKATPNSSPEQAQWRLLRARLSPERQKQGDDFVKAYLQLRYQDPRSSWNPAKAQALRSGLQKIPAP